MNIIVDASVIIAVLVNEPQKNRIVKLTEGADLLAPSSIHWEIGNAFSAMLKRESISLQQALSALQAYQKIPIRFVDVELVESLKIVFQTHIYAYDAYLIRCSMLNKCPLITLDKTLSKLAKQMGIDTIEV
jgi:predicted nucleic acid-binding protein